MLGTKFVKVGLFDVSNANFIIKLKINFYPNFNNMHLPLQIVLALFRDHNPNQQNHSSIKIRIIIRVFHFKLFLMKCFLKCNTIYL